MNPSMCMNPQNFVEDIKTPLLVIESSYDNYQVSSGTGISCATTYHNCSATDLTNIKAFRQMVLKTLQQHIPKDSNSPYRRGLFVHSCDSHTHLDYDKWRSPSISLGGKTIQKAIRDWYFERSPVYEVDSSEVEPSACTCPSEDICV
ncbi:hypothetical protein M569_02364 [Genlisea aurea]|uniref:Pectin acetylesterase n=1 Tax=Genlisea aurea TaxID=192259 RepID=S8D4W8_9LAMI|nr:hypothetical protein M569_02364 [Genlisea aurea]